MPIRRSHLCRRPAWLAASLLLALSAAAQASGGYSDEQRVGTSRLQPEPAAMPRFLNGQLGVLWPSYERSYLMLAYRQAQGLKPAHEEALAALLKPTSQEAPSTTASDTKPYGAQNWIETRRQFGLRDTPYPIESGIREQISYVYSENCQPGAFELAALTLAQRQRDHGQAGDWVKLWAQGQDAVFSTCDKRNTALSLPTLPADAPRWLQQDQAYQAAAMLLYQDKLAEASRAFNSLAADTASPWHEWAGYLSVRSWWRETFTEPAAYATLREAAPSWAEHPMAQRLQQTVREAKDEEVREAAQELYDILATRYAPKAAHLALWQQMNEPEPVPDLDGWISSARWLWAVMPEADYADDWLFQTRKAATAGIRSTSSDAAQKLIVGWQRTQSPIWLASALMALSGKATSDPSQADLDTLIDASRQYQADHPLYLHFAWQRARLTLAREDYAGARKELAQVAPQLKRESLGTRQAFDQLSMLAAADLPTLARYLVRTSLGKEIIDSDFAQFVAEEPTPLIEQASRSWLLANLNGEDLLSLAKIKTLPDAIRLQLAGEAWRMGTLLDQPKLEQSAYETWSSLSSQKIAPAAQRSHLARGMLLKALPRVNQSESGVAATGYHSWTPSEQPADYRWETRPAFQNTAQRAAKQTDFNTLRERNETEWLGRQILPWLSTQPKSAEGPALLEKLVWESRRGMRHTPTSRAAFQLLHKQYPNSPEAQRTRHYY